MYPAHIDTLGLNPVPAELFGTRQAIFYLMRTRPQVTAPHSVAAQGAGQSRPAAAVPPAARGVLWRDFLLEDGFVF